jgi:hypothetical protein
LDVDVRLTRGPFIVVGIRSGIGMEITQQEPARHRTSPQREDCTRRVTRSSGLVHERHGLGRTRHSGPVTPRGAIGFAEQRPPH